jgi:hypothetical protein
LVRGRTAGRLAAALAAAVLLACQQKSPEEDLMKKVEPVGSWLASLEMTGQKWAANSVPTSFVRNITAVARKQLEKAAEEAGRSRARPGLRNPLRQILAEAQAANAGLRQAVAANDRRRLAREVSHLAGLHTRFEALRKAEEGAP